MNYKLSYNDFNEANDQTSTFEDMVLFYEEKVTNFNFNGNRFYFERNEDIDELVNEI